MNKYRDRFYFGNNGHKALERDNYICQICGMTNKEHIKKWKREITVDHIDGNGRYSQVKNNNLDNLMTLCLSCHGEKDIRRRKDLLFSKVGYCKKGHKLTDLKYYKYCKVCQIERNKKQTTILGMDKREYFRKYMNNYYHTVVVHKRCLKGLQS